MNLLSVPDRLGTDPGAIELRLGAPVRFSKTWEVRRSPTVKIRTTNGVSNGKESHWIP